MTSTQREQTATGDGDEGYETLVRIMATKLKLPLEPEWVPGIAQQLATTLAVADMLESVELPDDAQPAPVFTP
jgi:hypothetical protein